MNLNNKQAGARQPILPKDIDSEYPWIPSSKGYHFDAIGLHDEIVDFFRYIGPSKQEHTSRVALIERIERVVMRTWANAAVEVFGSAKTGLYLPTSDIDLCVCLDVQESQKTDVLRALKNSLADEGFSSPDSIMVLDLVHTPIIKFTDRATLYKVDIGVNLRNHRESATFTAQQIRNFPQLPYLLFVLKQFLSYHQLLEVYSGGINSYSLVLMIISMLQLRSKVVNWRTQKVNLGVLLLEFFELYGQNFNHETCSINVLDQGSYEQRSFMENHNSNCKYSVRIIWPFELISSNSEVTNKSII